MAINFRGSPKWCLIALGDDGGTLYPEGYKADGGGMIYAKNASIGIGVIVKSDIGSKDRPLEQLYLGDHVYIGEGCNIQVPELIIGDYTKIHRGALIYGRQPLKIGYNCWIGEHTIIDAEGRTTIGNGVGAGAYSQLWSHIRHGDVLEGCRYLNFGELSVEDDVWFVGSCIVSPIHAAKKSVALVGSVVTRDMEENHVYGGSPAKDLTDKLGQPFESREIYQKYTGLINRWLEFKGKYKESWTDPPIDILTSFCTNKHLGTQFNVTTRTYTKTGSPIEVAFMKFLLPEVKFTPEGESLPECTH